MKASSPGSSDWWGAGEPGSTGAVGAQARTGQGALSPWLALHQDMVSPLLVVHKDMGWESSLSPSWVIISINNGNHIPGLWVCTEVGTVTLGIGTVTQRDGASVGVCGGRRSLGSEHGLCLGQTCGAEELGPGCWKGDDLPMTGGVVREH